MIRGHERVADSQGNRTGFEDQPGPSPQDDPKWGLGCGKGRAGIPYSGRMPEGIR